MLKDDEAVGIKTIRTRAAVFTVLILVCMILGLISEVVVEHRGTIFLFMAILWVFTIFYGILFLTSTCPRCKNNFGSVRNIRWRCQSCGLKLWGRNV